MPPTPPGLPPLAFLWLFALLRIPWLLAMDSFSSHSKRYAAWWLGHFALALLVQALYSRRADAARRRPRARLLATLLLLPAALLYLYACARLLPPFVLLFDTAWLLALLPWALLHLWKSPRFHGLALALSMCGLLLALGEPGLRAAARRRPALPDYGGLVRADLAVVPAGRLLPGRKLAVQGERGPVDWQTDAQGFRRGREAAPVPSTGTLRVLYLGDSFVAGYRVGQAEFSGAVLERRLNEAALARGVPTRFEVLAAGAEDPAQAWLWLRRYGLDYRPRLVLFGVCLGNDIAQAHIFTRPGSYYRIGRDPLSIAPAPGTPSVGFHSPEFRDAWLPPECFRPRRPTDAAFFRELPDAYALTATGALLDNLAGLWRPAGISTVYGDGPFSVHLVDPAHGLGFSLKTPPPVVADAFHSLDTVLQGIGQTCQARGVAFAAALFPQRYAVSPADWRAAVRRYALDPAAFDPRIPSDRVEAGCRLAGIPCRNLLPLLAAHAGEGLFQGKGDMHWNARGHALVGADLAEFAAALLPEATPRPEPAP